MGNKNQKTIGLVVAAAAIFAAGALTGKFVTETSSGVDPAAIKYLEENPEMAAYIAEAQRENEAIDEIVASTEELTQYLQDNFRLDSVGSDKTGEEILRERLE